jgi:hypothetical protein
VLAAFVNLIWPLLMLSFGPTWLLFRLPAQTLLVDPLLLLVAGRVFPKCRLSHFLEGPGRSVALRGRRPSG